MRGAVTVAAVTNDAATRRRTPAASSDIAVAGSGGITHDGAPAAPQGSTRGCNGADGFGV